jgi:putative ABC transport system ATP-binding protein
MKKKILKVKNLTKKYKDGHSSITALDNVSFELEEGESMAIIGPSGSGKTTLLEIIAGLNKPTGGEVIVDEINVHKGNDNQISKFRNKTLGFVFQMMHLQDYFNAVENVTLPLIAAGVPAKESKKRAIELLKQVGLEERMTHYPRKLSGGEMQRVAIARALVNNPKIIMADEPTGKLDRNNAENIMSIFDEINQKGVSVIIITHDEKIASRYKNVLQLEHGKVVR